MAITFADVSQWQPTFDPDAYLAGGHTVIILRAYSKDDGPDQAIGERQKMVRQRDFTAIGYYQRLNADRDPAAQARDFMATVGELQDNEFPILDLEDGSGDQTRRADAWFAVVDPWCGFQASLYSGEYFMRDSLGGTGQWGDRPLWIANYTNSGRPDEPTPAGSDWWQYSSTSWFPGLTGDVDANTYPNTAQAFLELVRHGAPPKQEDDIMAIAAALNEKGSLHVFVEAKDGAVWYTYQPAGKNSWNGGKEGQKLAGLARFAPAPGKDKY